MRLKMSIVLSWILLIAAIKSKQITFQLGDSLISANSEQEAQYRYQLYQRNNQKINEFNHEPHTYRQRSNQFTAMSEEEWASTYLTFQATPIQIQLPTHSQLQKRKPLLGMKEIPDPHRNSSLPSTQLRSQNKSHIQPQPQSIPSTTKTLPSQSTSQPTKPFPPTSNIPQSTIPSQLQSNSQQTQPQNSPSETKPFPPPSLNKNHSLDDNQTQRATPPNYQSVPSNSYSPQPFFYIYPYMPNYMNYQIPNPNYNPYFPTSNTNPNPAPNPNNPNNNPYYPPNPNNPYYPPNPNNPNTNPYPAPTPTFNPNNPNTNPYYPPNPNNPNTNPYYPPNPNNPNNNPYYPPNPNIPQGPPIQLDSPPTEVVNTTALKEIDHRLWIGVTTVKDQGSCSSCYAFTAAGAVESLLLMKGEYTDLSEQELVDCTSNSGCTSGSFDPTFEYIVKKGIHFEKDYPYREVRGACKQLRHSAKVKVDAFSIVSDKLVKGMWKGCQATYNALAKQPLAVGVVASSKWMHYSQGLFSDCSNGDLNHALVLVAFVPQGQANGYWIGKNSWGRKWGHNGFIKISAAGTLNSCSICDYVAYPYFQ